jgi:hypothetical protein
VLSGCELQDAHGISSCLPESGQSEVLSSLDLGGLFYEAFFCEILQISDHQMLAESRLAHRPSAPGTGKSLRYKTKYQHVSQMICKRR